MDTKKRKQLVLGILVFMLVAALGKNLFFRPKLARKPLPAASSDRVVSMLSLMESIRQNEKLVEAQESAWDREWGRDPFMPEELGAVAAGGSINLTGIVWDAKMPVAMINEKVMKVGDRVGGYTIVRIQPNFVVFSSSEGGEFELPLFKRTE